MKRTQTTSIAFEVEMTKTNIRQNVIKDIDVGIHFVVVVCWNEKVLRVAKEIISGLPDRYSSKTQALLVSQLLKQNPEQFINEIIKRR